MKGFTTSGFTLIEILVIMGFFLILLSMGLIFGLDSISRSTLVSERDLVVLMLTGARTRALANVNETSHGVRIESGQAVIFEGAPPGTDQRITERNSAITVSPEDEDIVFEPLTARLSDDVQLVLSDGSKTAVIDINTEGRIEW